MAIDDELDKILEGLVVESRVPKLGIWWLVNGKVISFQEEFRDVAPVGPSRDSDLLHFTEFDKLGLPGDYTDYERGRVIFLEGPKQFVIYCSEDVAKSKEAIARVARDFSLPLAKLKVAVDPHYKMGDSVDFGDYEDFD